MTKVVLCNNVEEFQGQGRGETVWGNWELRQAYSRGNVDGADVANVLNTTFTPPTASFLPDDAHVVGI